MIYTSLKQHSFEPRYKELTIDARMFSSLKSLFCCFNVRRVYQSVIQDQAESNNHRDVFYPSNAPVGPLYVYG
ncbi:hypothetical protein GCK72_023711 [Caenorhabditis remanei]|nr:hypothetical protein GCK72_023711 [Caenorhabditis remanei]KAF1747249.1 hypothetical protein GCK72_023711 [Caenorhabditis remanei]